MKLLKLALPLALMAGAAHAESVTIDSCDVSQTFAKAPTRAITLNQ